MPGVLYSRDGAMLSTAMTDKNLFTLKAACGLDFFIFCVSCNLTVDPMSPFDFITADTSCTTVSRP